MLELTKGTASEKIILTLTELTTLNEPNFLFVFTHTLTKTQVKFVRLETDEESSYPSRYNQFSVATVTTFLNKPVGEWLYEVYEQESTTNTDPALSTGLVENGKMILYPATADEFEYEKYNEPVTYKAYQG